MEKFLPSFFSKIPGLREDSAPASMATEALDFHDGPPNGSMHKPGGPYELMRVMTNSRYHVELQPTTPGQDWEYGEVRSLPDTRHRHEGRPLSGDVTHAGGIVNGGQGTAVDAHRDPVHGPPDDLTDDGMTSDEEGDMDTGGTPGGLGIDLGKIARKLEKSISERDLDSGTEMLKMLVDWRAEVRVHILSANRQRKAPDPPFSIQVVVETAAVGTGPRWKMQVKRTMTIFAMKMKVALLYGIPISQQSWIIGRDIPTDTDVIGECGVHADAEVFLYINKQRLEDSREEKRVIERFHRDILMKGDNKDMELCFTSDEYQKYLKEVKLQQSERIARGNQSVAHHTPHDPRQNTPHQPPHTMAGYQVVSRGHHQGVDHNGGMFQHGGPDQRQPDTFAGYDGTRRGYRDTDMPTRSQQMPHVYMEQTGPNAGGHGYNGQHPQQYHDMDNGPRPYHPNGVPPEEPADPQYQLDQYQREDRFTPPPHLVENGVSPRGRTGSFRGLVSLGPVAEHAVPTTAPRNVPPKMRTVPLRPMDLAQGGHSSRIPQRAVSMGDIHGRFMSYDGSMDMAPAAMDGHRSTRDDMHGITPFMRGDQTRRLKKAKKKQGPGADGFGFHDDHFQEPRKHRNGAGIPPNQDAFGFGVPEGMPRRRYHNPNYMDGEPPERFYEADFRVRGPTRRKPKASDVGWKCPACTFVNPPSYPSCKQCLQERPANYPVPPRGSYIMDEGEKRMVTEREANEAQFAQLQVIEDEKRRQKARRHRDELRKATGANVMVNEEEFECPICFSEVPPGEGIRLQECLHEVCRDCCVTYINKSDDAQITCPFTDGDNDCQQTILDREIRQIVGNGNYEAFAERSLKKAEATSANTFHCLTPNCRGFCFYDDDHNFFNCPICKQNNCLTCNVVHDGMNCKQYQDDINVRAVNDQNARETQDQLQRLIREGRAQNCPQCGVVIQKKGGCPNMTCSVCHRAFKWTGIEM